ncbi:DUF968 domain-containing protein [Erwinia pyrifoliae]|uniref:DUF968 domain-containing protein n=1 Tax=Erwinia pyrifoliae TaxID=79967 RepID=A0ABY5X3K9_ERWPY|nr:DUF968 domain-containing protein [Erwinia pyrifoliae]UWS31963.1 DUF968 domain-containing protein [Erwinia pyrifoliae]UXK13826.1 DUF968 domain-containing protein [Erwinia pyrifoliae]
MRALLTPEIAPRLGVVLFRPGADVMNLFRQGRVLIENVPEHLKSLPSGHVPAALQPLADDPALHPFLTDERVISAAGGLNGLEYWLVRQDGGCQWAHGDYHHPELVTLRHPPGAVRLCWSCDNRLREQSTDTLEGLAASNVFQWVIHQARQSLGFDESHVLTLPELCWWAIRCDVVAALPEGMARKALRMPDEVMQSVTRESDIVPAVQATRIVLAKAQSAHTALRSHESLPVPEKPVLKLATDPESPESFMLRPKRRRWENQTYTRWVKTQPCAGCGRPADDPHHIIGHGMGGTGTKAHDLFVIPLCRCCHNELHADVAAFETKYGTQLALLFRFLDRVLAIGVIATAKKNSGDKNA